MGTYTSYNFKEKYKDLQRQAVVVKKLMLLLWKVNNFMGEKMEQWIDIGKVTEKRIITITLKNQCKRQKINLQEIS